MSVHGGCLPHYMLGYTPPPGRHPPRQTHPSLGRHLLPWKTPLGDTPLAGTPTPLGRYNPSGQTFLGRHPPRAGTPLLGRHPFPGQTPPSAVHAGMRSTSGRYASHWNAFLFLNNILFSYIINSCTLFYCDKLKIALRFFPQKKNVNCYTCNLTSLCVLFGKWWQSQIGAALHHLSAHVLLFTVLFWNAPNPGLLVIWCVAHFTTGTKLVPNLGKCISCLLLSPPPFWFILPLRIFKVPGGIYCILNLKFLKTAVAGNIWLCWCFFIYLFIYFILFFLRVTKLTKCRWCQWPFTIGVSQYSSRFTTIHLYWVPKSAKNVTPPFMITLQNRHSALNVHIRHARN